MNPISTISFLPAMEVMVASRYFARYLVLAFVLVILYVIMQKSKKEG